MAELKTNYLGLNLKSPIVASASPLTENISNVKALEDAGVGAIVFHSLFEEQIDMESTDLHFALSQGEESFAEAASYFPDTMDYRLGPEAYIEQIAKAKEAVSIPIIGSLNGVSSGGWIEYAKKIQDAGADALELNIYYIPTDPSKSGADVEDQYVNILQEVKKAVSIPVAVKVGPQFSAPAAMAKRLDDAGADALVLFNRFYQPEFDLEALEVVSNLTLSSPSELLLRLRWVAILFGQIKADMAITGGVHTASDVLKSMMAGAKVAMMTSAILKNGIGYVKTVEKELLDWMEEKEYESIEQMQGSMSQRSIGQAAAFERANYLKVLNSYAGQVEL
jgi:dihydroorotate dehydrogenase (fumarate)